MPAGLKRHEAAPELRWHASDSAEVPRQSYLVTVELLAAEPFQAISFSSVLASIRSGVSKPSVKPSNIGAYTKASPIGSPSATRARLP